MGSPRTLRAFTLVELMIALSLGLVIVYTAMSGFRVAAQSITIANRLSLENSLLRAGYFQVEDDLDFWTSLDDPLNPANQTLRGTAAGSTVAAPLNQAGNPFTPMRTLYAGLGFSPTVQFTSAAVSPGSRTTYGEIKARPSTLYPSGGVLATDGWENDRGFDPSAAYSPSDPRTWVRTNLAEKDFAGNSIFPYGPYTPVATFGRYGLFSNASASPTFNNWQIGVTTPFNNLAYAPGSAPPYLVTYSGLVTHTWYPNQLQFFLSALGYEAMFEYLPPNAIYEYYLSYTAAQFTYGGAPNFQWTPQGSDASNQWAWNIAMDGNSLSRHCTQPGWGYWGGFRNWDGNQITACGMYRETYSTSMGYFNPWAPADPNGEPGIFNRHYMHFDSDYTAYLAAGAALNNATNGGPSGLQDLLSHTANKTLLVAQYPLTWPAIKTCVGRMIKNDHHIAVAKIDRLDPLTGKISELSFVGLGTTLRGARMQRAPGGGWAAWDDQPGTANPANLDSP